MDFVCVLPNNQPVNTTQAKMPSEKKRGLCSDQSGTHKKINGRHAIYSTLMSLFFLSFFPSIALQTAIITTTETQKVRVSSMP